MTGMGFDSGPEIGYPAGLSWAVSFHEDECLGSTLKILNNS
jgi:hypothetical protein